MRCLIIGQNSFLGQKLFAKLSDRKHQVFGTSRADNNKTKQSLKFDLGWPKDKWPAFPDRLDSLFLASALTSQKSIEENQEYARLINVEQTLEIISFFLERGVHIVFPSTNLVLANDIPDQKIDAPWHPLSLYATLKAEVEKELLKYPSQATICRLPKILGASTPLIQTWYKKLKKKEEIQALTDLIAAPVSVTYAINLLAEIMEQRPGGIIHISGQETSYYNIASSMAEKLQVSAQLVVPQTSQALGISLESSPEHPGLNTDRTEKIFGIPSQKLDELIADIID